MCLFATELLVMLMNRMNEKTEKLKCVVSFIYTKIYFNFIFGIKRHGKSDKFTCSKSLVPAVFP